MLPCWATCILFFAKWHIFEIWTRWRGMFVYDRTAAPLVINVLCITEVAWPWGKGVNISRLMWMMFNPHELRQLRREDRFINCCACRLSNGIRVDIRWMYRYSVETFTYAAPPQIQLISFTVSFREQHIIAALAKVPFVIVHFYNTHLNNS